MGEGGVGRWGARKSMSLSSPRSEGDEAERIEERPSHINPHSHPKAGVCPSRRGWHWPAATEGPASASRQPESSFAYPHLLSSVANLIATPPP